MAKQGEDLEKIVEIIERSISPNSIIKHNQFLPILSSKKGHKAQCDIVIYTGKPPRQTITIVEVQDRGSAVDINTFRGWLQKLEQVGAQHLICVSKLDFPSSIKEQAEQSGAKVLLITLKEIPKDQIPLDLIKIIFMYNHFDITNIRKATPYVKPGGISKHNLKPFSSELNSEIFSTDKINRKSLFSLCRDHIEDKENFQSGIHRGTTTLHFDINSNPIYYSNENEFIEIGLECTFDWECEVFEKPMSVASYEQDSHGVLAWVFEASHNSKNGNIHIRIPVVKLESGYFDVLKSVVKSPFEYRESFLTKKP